MTEEIVKQLAGKYLAMADKQITLMHSADSFKERKEAYDKGKEYNAKASALVEALNEIQRIKDEVLKTEPF